MNSNALDSSLLSASNQVVAMDQYMSSSGPEDNFSTLHQSPAPQMLKQHYLTNQISANHPMHMSKTNHGQFML
jgi:hypothetical protein